MMHRARLPVTMGARACRFETDGGFRRAQDGGNRREQTELEDKPRAGDVRDVRADPTHSSELTTASTVTWRPSYPDETREYLPKRPSSSTACRCVRTDSAPNVSVPSLTLRHIRCTRRAHVNDQVISPGILHPCLRSRLARVAAWTLGLGQDPARERARADARRPLHDHRVLSG